MSDALEVISYCLSTSKIRTTNNLSNATSTTSINNRVLSTHATTPSPCTTRTIGECMRIQWLRCIIQTQAWQVGMLQWSRTALTSRVSLTLLSQLGSNKYSSRLTGRDGSNNSQDTPRPKTQNRCGSRLAISERRYSLRT